MLRIRAPAEDDGAWHLPQGGWVKVGDQVGIVNDGGADWIEVHIVNAAGETVRIERVSLDDPALIRATWRDLPESRRPSRERAEALGYP